MSFESPDHSPEITQEDAVVLYDSLPEGMKTGYYGLMPQGALFSSKQEAGPDALPHVIVTFADGRRLSLHLTLSGESSFEQQAGRLKDASRADQHITNVELVWQSASK